MKRPRPHIPMAVRVTVARRQMEALGRQPRAPVGSFPLGAQLREFLYMADLSDAQLDHDPALILRPFNPRTGKYTPDANDPAALIYRTKADHLQKTTGRKPGATKTITTKGSDVGLKAKFDRLEGRTKKKPKAKIAGRGFDKSRRKRMNGTVEKR